jgi:hypothetical protein
MRGPLRGSVRPEFGTPQGRERPSLTVIDELPFDRLEDILTAALVLKRTIDLVDHFAEA